MARTSQEQRFDAWWPDVCPFPPSMPWLGTAVTRSIAWDFICGRIPSPRASTRSKYYEEKDWSKNYVAVPPSPSPGEDRLAGTIKIDTDGFRASYFADTYNERKRKLMDAITNGGYWDSQQLSDAEESLFNRVRYSTNIVHVITYVYDATSRIGDYEFEWWCGISDSASTGIGASPVADRWERCGSSRPTGNAGVIDEASNDGDKDFDKSMTDGNTETESAPAGSAQAYTHYPLSTSEETGRTIEGEASGSTTIATSEGYVPSGQNRKFDANGDGKVSLCEWLTGIFGCVPPPWVPDRYISALGGLEELSFVDFEMLMSQLDQQISNEDVWFNGRVRSVITPMEQQMLYRTMKFTSDRF